jgi:GT2 family glycosyltransferase
MSFEGMRLTAIVPASDRPLHLDRCLSAIRAAEDGPEEVVVVESAPAPGPAAARNAGAQKATGDVLVFVDADVVLHPDAFCRIRAAFDADTDLVALFGSYDDVVEAPDTVSAFRNLLHHHVHQRSAGPATTFWAGLGAIRRETFGRVGGFDSGRYPEPSIEDIELGMRLAASGARIRLDPELQGTHLKRWSLGSMIQTDFRRRGVPWVALLARTRSRSTALNLAWRYRASAAASVAFTLATLNRQPRLAAGALGTMLALNLSFYSLVLKRRGAVQALGSVGLHIVHHLTATCAVPVGLADHMRERLTLSRER